MKFLQLISKIIVKKPVKIILISIVFVLLLGIGAQNIRMATGNDTLIEPNSRVYQDNLALESDFGGESIIVLYEVNNNKDLLTIENFNHMKQLETSLMIKEEVFTIMSPVTIIEQMTNKQNEKYQEGLNEVIDGLESMGTKLLEISSNLSDKANQPINLPNIDQQMVDLTKGINQMISGQKKLQDGTITLVNGYKQFGNQTSQVAQNILALSNQLEMEMTDPKNIQQIQQLKKTSNQLLSISDQMIQTSVKTSELPKASENTIQGLQKMQKGVSSQKTKMNPLEESKTEQVKSLNELGKGLQEMGNNLVSISGNLTTMLDYSDVMNPGLPKKQSTLDHLLYEENGQLKSIFNELIIDNQYMIFMVKINGDVNDSQKSKLVAEMKEFLENNKVENTKMMVSGKPVLDDAIRSSMKESMQKMMMLSILLMVVVLFVVFKVKWRILPLVIILVALLGTVGLMGWINIPVTMVSMAVFPILIGLGIDYAIQFQSRYVEEMEKGENTNEG